MGIENYKDIDKDKILSNLKITLDLYENEEWSEDIQDFISGKIILLKDIISDIKEGKFDTK